MSLINFIVLVRAIADKLPGSLAIANATHGRFSILNALHMPLAHSDSNLFTVICALSMIRPDAECREIIHFQINKSKI